MYRYHCGIRRNIHTPIHSQYRPGATAATTARANSAAKKFGINTRAVNSTKPVGASVHSPVS